ncbi:hypothetical protein AB6G07_20550 [Providencia stuartii]|uniref:hypothetical protein n=1 Tax=Morganellaceae TaxID=1903414 RepID=UPI002023D73C|nr:MULTISPECIES: hypothetical protein [Morganellaceae]MCL8621843.1 hypothetical protein [Proteus mirabilis]MCL8632868.1 hypothetical protein [Proteus mirabilis]MDT1068557.1 hypothetical protein [Providencia stuartii]
MRPYLLISIFSALFLSGCSDNMPPKCDSKETKQLLNQVVVDYFNQLGVRNITPSITGHEMIEKHEKAKEYTCEARVVITLPNGKMNSDIVNYSVFLDENKKGQFFVQINE